MISQVKKAYEIGAVKMELPNAKPYGVLKREDEPEVKSMTMDFVTLNTWLRTRPIGTQIFERSDRIANSLKDYDVVGLQETFSGGAKHIPDKLKKEGTFPYSFRQSTPRILTNSGLTMVSKYPIIEKDFQQFTYSTGSDSLAKKGVMFNRLEVPNIGQVDVYNTHYNAGGTQKTGFFNKIIEKFIPGWTMATPDVRVTENTDLANFIKKHEKGNPTFITGDFNMNETKIEYQDLKNKINMIDSFRLINPDDPGYTADGPNNPHKPDDGQSRIDYIFYKPGKNVNVEVLQSRLTHNHAIDGMFVSDHFGVNSTFKLTKKTN
jgi:endonuclease/exonuclease/phosphatase family metal-dependent hydrolase